MSGAGEEDVSNRALTQTLTSMDPTLPVFPVKSEEPATSGIDATCWNPTTSEELEQYLPSSYPIDPDLFDSDLALNASNPSPYFIDVPSRPDPFISTRDSYTHWLDASLFDFDAAAIRQPLSTVQGVDAAQGFATSSYTPDGQISFVPSSLNPQPARSQLTYAQAAALPSSTTTSPPGSPTALRTATLDLRRRSPHSLPRSESAMLSSIPSRASSVAYRREQRSAGGFQCECCKLRFDIKRDLNRHQVIHTAEVDRPFRCRICDQGFLWQKDLDRHAIKHTKEKRFKCALCKDKVFTRNDNLRRHYIREHPNEELPGSSRSAISETSSNPSTGTSSLG